MAPLQHVLPQPSPVEDGLLSLLEWKGRELVLRRDLTCVDRVQTMRGILAVVKQLEGHPLKACLLDGSLSPMLLDETSPPDLRGLSDNWRTIVRSALRRFVRVPAGEFMMGAGPNDGAVWEYEEPCHRVRITRSMYVSKYLVTQGWYEEMMLINPSRLQGATRPVENISPHRS